MLRRPQPTVTRSTVTTVIVGGGRLGWKRRCNGWKAHQQHLLGGHQKRHLAAGLAVSHQKTLATEPNDSSMGNLEIVQPAYLPLGCDFLHVVH